MKFLKVNFKIYMQNKLNKKKPTLLNLIVIIVNLICIAKKNVSLVEALLTFLYKSHRHYYHPKII